MQDVTFRPKILPYPQRHAPTPLERKGEGAQDKAVRLQSKDPKKVSVVDDESSRLNSDLDHLNVS